MSVLEAASAGVKDMADGSLRITIEFDPRFAKEAFALFGARGTPLAIAALKVGYAAVGESTIKESLMVEKPKGGALAKLAGMWCADPEFIGWINKAYVQGEPLRGEAGAIGCLRDICQIDSRAELDHDGHAAELFHRLIRGPYSKHLIARGITV